MPERTEKNRFSENSKGILRLQLQPDRNASAEFPVRQLQRKSGSRERIPCNIFYIESKRFSGNPQTIPLIFFKVASRTFSENWGLPLLTARGKIIIRAVHNAQMHYKTQLQPFCVFTVTWSRTKSVMSYGLQTFHPFILPCANGIQHLSAGILSTRQNARCG